MDTVVKNNNTGQFDYDQFIPCGYYAINEPEVEASQFIRMYVFPIILFTGLVCNPVTAFALYVIGVHKWSTVFYFSLLSVVDLLILLIRAGDSWYAQIVNDSLSRQLMDASDAMCKTYHFVFMFMKHMSAWLMVAVSMELMISTKWPRKTYSVCTMERARNVVMLLVILIFCLDINYFWTWGVPNEDAGCTYTEKFSTEFRDMIWPAMDNTVELFLPLIFVSICFFITATTMIGRKSRNEKSIEEELNKYFLELQTIKDFQLVCLVICLVFMCLTIFKIILNIVEFMIIKDYLVLDCQGKSKYNLFNQLCKTLDMVFTFLFYTLKVIPCFVFSSAFRQTLLDGYLCCKRVFLRMVRKFSAVPGNNKNKRTFSKSGGSERGSTPQHMKPLVNYSHRSRDKETTLVGVPLDRNHVTVENNDHRREAVATVENHSMDDSTSSFIGVGTDV